MIVGTNTDEKRDRPLVQAQTITPIKVQKTSGRQKISRGMILASIGSIILIKIYLVVFVIDLITGIYGLITTSLVFVAFLFTFLKYQDPSVTAKFPPPEKPHFVSVIIPAKNDPVIIRKSMAAILNSTYHHTEVIFINDGSTDDTGAVMDELHKENPERVKVIHMVQNVGKRRAIREALLQGSPKGDIVILIDSDSVVKDDAIERMVRVFDDPDVGAATGSAKVINVEQNTLTKIQDTWYDGQFFVIKGMESCFNSVTCCSGSLSAYRKEAIMPCLEAWCNDKFLGIEFRPGDDRHLTSYVLGGNKHYIDRRNRSWKVVYCAGALVYTEAPSTLRKFVNQQIRWKKSWVRVFLFNAPFFFKNRHVISVLYYYTQMTLSLLAPIIAYRALVYLPLNGRVYDAMFYLFGLLFLGLMFGITYKLRNPDTGDRWLYRILMTPLSVFFSSLMYYSIFTVKNKSWLTR